MRVSMVNASVIAMVIACVGWLSSRPVESGSAQRPSVTTEQVQRWMKDLSNWGRWGNDDQLGTLNLITDEKRRQAVALAKTGTVVSLAYTQPALVPKVETEAGSGPRAHLEIQLSLLPSGYTTEQQQLAFHGSTFTHLDAVCHGDYDGKLYNGYPLKDTIDETGCKKLGIDTLQGGILTRGILVDIPRLKGAPYLEPGTRVYADDIEAWERKAGVTISAGDAVLLHTGRWVSGETSGFDISVAPWLKARDVALVGSDGTLEAGQVEGEPPLPLHHFVLVALGSPIIDNADLGSLSETAARLNRWEFLLVLSPIATPGGTGSPVNPLAIF